MIKVYLPTEDSPAKIKIISLGYFAGKLHQGHYQFIHKRWNGYYEDANGRFSVKKDKR